MHLTVGEAMTSSLYTNLNEKVFLALSFFLNGRSRSRMSSKFWELLMASIADNGC